MPMASPAPRTRQDETSPLLARHDAAPSPSSPPLGTARFPFHPNALTTPRWRKLLMRFFDGHRQLDTLEDRDVWPLEPQFDGMRAARDLANCRPRSGRWRLTRALVALNGRRLMWISAWQVVAALLSVARPLLLLHWSRVALPIIESSSARRVFGWDVGVFWPLAGVFIAEIALAFVRANSEMIGARVEVATTQSLWTTAINKLMGADTAATPVESSVGPASTRSLGRKERLAEIAATLSNDIQGSANLVLDVFVAVVSLLRLGATLFVLSRVIEFSSLVVAIVAGGFVAVVVLEVAVGEPLSKLTEAARAARLNAVNECVKCVQMVKLSASEVKAERKIQQLRSTERVTLARVKLIGLITRQVAMEAPMLVAALLFRGTVAMSPGRVFVVLVLLTDAVDSVSMAKRSLYGTIAGLGAWQRVDDFLYGSTTREDDRSRNRGPQACSFPSDPDHVAELRGVCVASAFRTSSNPALLLDIEWTLKKRDLVVIYGAAGVGKSTLLAALRGDNSVAKTVHGTFQGITSDCRIAYCPQDPWLQTLSIRENILFGTAFDEHKYWAVVDACGLLEDLDALPSGDATAVGPRGINLSSGQSARIALARACYADADLYLLDCPLANVDAVVQSEIFRKCIVELLMFKTVVIVTHNPEYIGSSFVDQLLEVKPLRVCVKTQVASQGGSTNIRGDSIRITRRMRDFQQAFTKQQQDNGSLRIHPLAGEARRVVDRIESASWHVQPRRWAPMHATNQILGVTVSEYCRGDGTHSLLWSGLAGLLSVSWGMMVVLRDLTLMQWAALPNDHTIQTIFGNGAGAFGLLVLACIGLRLASRGCIFAFNSLTVDRLFHRMTHGVLRASMSFFYKTPIGETVSPFFLDIVQLDEHLPWELSLLVLSCITFLAQAVVFAWILGPVGLIVALAGLALLARTASVPFYIQTERGTLQAQAQQVSLMSELFDGDGVVQAFGTESMKRQLCVLRQITDSRIRLIFMNEAFNNHTVMRSVAVAELLALSLLALLATYPVTPAEFALVLLYVFNLDQHICWGFVNGLVNSWAYMCQAERVRQMGCLDSETEFESSHLFSTNNELPHTWPSTGGVVFHRVSFSYTSNHKTESALRDVSFSIRGGEKIGVIGRTGSGKSSLAMALLRVHPLLSGHILLDGIDLRSVPLTQVRHSVTMIPQSPTFYRCSIRDYLDPFHEYDDARLWRELLTVDLGARVQSLDEELLDNGENWSLGQRQLLCFARALLRSSRVVLLDEAFSCVDQSCQEKILRILRERFASSTVILITHRLDQILEFDRILVMRGGRLVESGSASELANDASSLFYEFLETSLLTL